MKHEGKKETKPKTQKKSTPEEKMGDPQQGRKRPRIKSQLKFHILTFL